MLFRSVMLKGVNDSPAEARELVRLLKGVPAKINLIPFNPWPGAPYACSDWETIERFSDIVFNAGYASPVRSSAHNLRLSDMRAAAVEVALRSRGVPGDIIVRTHHGATPIIGPEIEGQRVEVVVSREDRARR
mgnify:CR=1 FL=1